MKKMLNVVANFTEFAKPLLQASNQQNKHKITTFNIFFHILPHIYFIKKL